MTDEMNVTSAISLAEKTWRYKLERVSKGYVRATVHGDDLEQLYKDWEDVHEYLERKGEAVENVKEIEAAEKEKEQKQMDLEYAKLEARNKKKEEKKE